jgi:hypothetical protein
MTVNADDASLDDAPHVLRVGEPQIRFPRDRDSDHQHIWYSRSPDLYASPHDEAGAPYGVEFCVNCPAIRVERAGKATSPKRAR